MAVPIGLGASTDQMFLLLLGNGWRFHSGLAGVTAKVGGTAVEAHLAGAQGNFVGLDQIHLWLPQSLRGRGNFTIALSVNGKFANQVSVNIK